MAGQSVSGERASGGLFGPVLTEALVLVLTLLASIVAVALLVFAPRALLMGGTPDVGLYLGSVREYVTNVLRGDFGLNRRQQPVLREIVQGGVRSLQLLGIASAAGLVIGLTWGGLLSTVRRGLPGLLLYGLSTLVLSLPTFVVLMLGIELVATITLRTGVRLALVQGYGLDQHLTLPAAVLALRGAAYMARAVQLAQDDIMAQDYIRVARAKGLGRLDLWRRHVLPALWLPVVGSVLGMLRVMVSGLVIVEFIYGWGGLGSKLLQMSQGGVIVPSNDQVAAGAAIVFVVFFILIDAFGRFLLRRADPRLREIASE